MALQSKSAKSIVKKDLENSKLPLIGVRKVVFAHKSAGGENGINLNSLTAPPEYTGAGFVQPSSSDLVDARLLFYRKNLKLVSTTKGFLLDYEDYTVASNTQINFTSTFGTTDVDEIIVGIIDPVVRSGTLVADSDSIVATGTLSAGSTDINIGKSKKIINLLYQIGAVEVIVDGQTLLRNASNATASPTADGDYEEVDNGQGEFTIVRLNSASGTDRSYIVKSTAFDLIRPDGSILDVVETQQGTIDNLVATVAALAGVPTTDFQSAPSQPLLTQYGDRVVDLESWVLVSSTTTLSVQRFQKIAADSSGAAFQIDLPNSPQRGDTVMIWDSLDSSGSNNITIGRNGNNIRGVADDALFDVNGAWMEFVWVGGSYGWAVRSQF